MVWWVIGSVVGGLLGGAAAYRAGLRAGFRGMETGLVVWDRVRHAYHFDGGKLNTPWGRVLILSENEAVRIRKNAEDFADDLVEERAKVVALQANLGRHREMVAELEESERDLLLRVAELERDLLEAGTYDWRPEPSLVNPIEHFTMRLKPGREPVIEPINTLWGPM